MVTRSPPSTPERDGSTERTTGKCCSTKGRVSGPVLGTGDLAGAGQDLNHEGYPLVVGGK